MASKDVKKGGDKPKQDMSAIWGDNKPRRQSVIGKIQAMKKKKRCNSKKNADGSRKETSESGVVDPNNAPKVGSNRSIKKTKARGGKRSPLDLLNNDAGKKAGKVDKNGNRIGGEDGESFDMDLDDEEDDDEMVDMTKVKEDEAPIDIEFAFFEPYETDYHGVKPFFAKSFDFCKKEPLVELSELTDAVCNQGNIGTVLKSSDEDSSTFGVCTILNIRQKKDVEKEMPSVVDLLNWAKKHLTNSKTGLTGNVPDSEELGGGGIADLLCLTEKAPEVEGISDKSGKSKKKALQVGLFINERLLNIPEETIKPMHQELLKGIAWSQTTSECPEEERPFYFFDYIVGVAHATTDDKTQQLIFPKFEEEEYVKASECYKAVAAGGEGGKEKRVIFVMKASKLKGVVGKL